MTPNLRYINQSAPFWDWIANFEQSASDHPFFGGHPHHPPPPHPPHHHAPGDDESPPPHPPHGHGQAPPPPHYPGAAPWTAPWTAAWAGPWARGFGGWHSGTGERGAPPHYYDHRHQHHHHNHEGQNASGEEQSADEKVGHDNDNGEGKASEDVAAAAAATNERGVPDPPEEAPAGMSDGEARGWGRQWKRCERRDRRFGPASKGHHHHGPPHRGRGRGGRGGPGGPGRGGFGMLRDLFGPIGAEHDNVDDSGDWKPEADVFDTEGSYVVHISLPGAHKEDIGVTWDPEKSELAVAGVVHRPGDEAFLKTLALDERKTGAFERKVRLGTRASPAHVDVEGITAKLENGILIVEVPKLNGEFVEVKKVDIE